jgi:hypothetical protein
MIHAIASGRHVRRRGRFPRPGGGRRCAPLAPAVSGRLVEVTACELSAGTMSRPSALVSCAAALAEVVCVAASPD